MEAKELDWLLNQPDSPSLIAHRFLRLSRTEFDVLNSQGMKHQSITGGEYRVQQVNDRNTLVDVIPKLCNCSRATQYKFQS